MRKFTGLLSLSLVVALACAAAGQQYGQQYAQEVPGQLQQQSPSVIRQTGFHGYGGYAGGWQNGYATAGCNYCYGNPHACQPAGCANGICYGYDNCCHHCCIPNLVCCLKKVGRMLDCLIPCKSCGCGGCGGCGGCALLHGGGCCGSCASSCCAPACDSGCPSCTTPAAGPGPTNPFQDDPPASVPVPTPDTHKDARHHPIWKTTPAKTAAASQAKASLAQHVKPTAIQQPQPQVAQQPKLPVVSQSRPAVAEVKPASAKAAPEVKPANALKPLMAVEVSATQSKPDDKVASAEPKGPAPIVTTSRRGNGPWSPMPTAAKPQAKGKLVAQSVLRRASLEEEIVEDAQSPSDQNVMPAVAKLPTRSVYAPAATPADNVAIPHNPLRR